jgi:hypothetical protein
MQEFRHILSNYKKKNRIVKTNSELKNLFRETLK